MAGDYWEFAGHTVALTGDGYCDPDYYDHEFNVRCIDCVSDDGSKILTFWTDEYSTPTGVSVDHDAVLRAIAAHLRTDMPVSDHIVSSAIMMAAFNDDIGVGMDFIHEQLSGRDHSLGGS